MVVKKIDELGRITIPKFIRQELNLIPGTSLAIIVDENGLVIRKKENICPLCLKEANLINVDDDITICEECCKKIKGDLS